MQEDQLGVNLVEIVKKSFFEKKNQNEGLVFTFLDNVDIIHPVHGKGNTWQLGLDGFVGDIYYTTIDGDASLYPVLNGELSGTSSWALQGSTTVVETTITCCKHFFFFFPKFRPNVLVKWGCYILPPTMV